MSVVNLKNLDKFSAKKTSVQLADPEKKTEKVKTYSLGQEKNKILARWEAPEFEAKPRDERKYIFLGFILTGIIFYAVYTNSPVMAITFILIGIVTYLYSHKAPRTLVFQITEEGIQAANELYEYENIRSFWIFYEPEGRKEISLHTRSILSPYVNIPVHDQDPVYLRECLMNYIPEIKQKPSALDSLEKALDL
jgi:hypothetical protein